MAEPLNAERLTKRTVDAALPAAGRYFVWDRDLKGFGLRVEPSGIKTFVVRYRVGGGRRGTLRQFKIGRFGKLSPDKAREAAEKALAEAELGKDPQAVRVAGREALTISELCDLYLKEGVTSKKDSTVKLDRIRIARHIKPLIGNRRITELSVTDVERMCQDIAAGRVRNEASPHTRGGPGAASRTVGLLGGIFGFALRRGLCTKNPAKGVRRPADVRRDRPLSIDDLARLGEALANAEAAGVHPHHASILHLLLLTGARKNEIAHVRWSEYDPEGKRLNLEDSKTGKRSIVLGDAALKIMQAQARSSSRFVFPDPKHADEPVRGLDWAWVGIRKRAGLADLRIHDLRHAFASVAASQGIALHTIGGLLGHAHHASTSRYAHLRDDPLRAAANDIAAPIAAALDLAKAEISRLKAAND